MKKILLPLSLLLLSGCQTAGQLGAMSRSGINGLSCNQIYAAFNAYERDRYSLDAWLQLLKIVKPELDAQALSANRTADQRYHDARVYASLVLMAQGCQPLQ